MMSDEDAHNFYANHENLRPQGPGVARTVNTTMSSHVPVRFPAEMIEAVKAEADKEGRTVSSWIQQVIREELARRHGQEPEMTE